MDAAAAPDAYLVYAWIRDIHPLLWRRVLVRADSTLADLHWTLQIVFGWTDFHLHRFRIRKTDYVIPRRSLMEGQDARQVRLSDLAFRPNERFLYEYDFGDLWQLEERIERQLSIAPRRTYPMCIGGRWGGPPEDCGGRRRSWSSAPQPRGACRSCWEPSPTPTPRRTWMTSRTTFRTCEPGGSG